MKKFVSSACFANIVACFALVISVLAYCQGQRSVSLAEDQFREEQRQDALGIIAEFQTEADALITDFQQLKNDASRAVDVDVAVNIQSSLDDAEALRKSLDETKGMIIDVKDFKPEDWYSARRIMRESLEYSKRVRTRVISVIEAMKTDKQKTIQSGVNDSPDSAQRVR